MTSVTFTGLSGRIYEYFPQAFDAEWFAVAGNYAFAYRPNGVWAPLYFGETSSFATRIPGHEKRASATLLGATHVLAHLTPGGAAVRQAEEEDLIRAYNPVCNVEHRTAGPGLFGLGRRVGATLLTGHAQPKRRATLLGDW
ncbi:MAG: hypothetical protein EXQ86_02275 [Rhodospirillales bacterium]|nr:hypothetical protein [Rhodospirillales bacterium]